MNFEIRNGHDYIDDIKVKVKPCILPLSITNQQAVLRCVM